MALAALFAKSASTAGGPADPFASVDLTDRPDALHPVKGRTLSYQTSSASKKTSAVSRLPKGHRAALQQAQATRSVSHFPEKSEGPLHFKLKKAGPGFTYDVQLGDPCRCEREIRGCPGRPCDESTSLFLTYFVLVRILNVPLNDPIVAQVPRLEARALERVLTETTRRKRRALGGKKTQFTEADFEAERAAYENEVVEGEAEFDFLAQLGRGIGTQSEYFLGRDIDRAEAAAKVAQEAEAAAAHAGDESHGSLAQVATKKSFDPARDQAWASVMVLVNTDPAGFRAIVRKVFKRLDFQGNGNVVIDELLEALRPFGIKLSLDQAKALTKQLDVFGHHHEDGQISMAELLGIVDAHAAECREIVWAKLMAEVDRDPNVWERNLKLMFQQFDSDGSGDIDLEELAQGLASLGIKLLQDQLVALRNEMDFDGDGQISLAEFSTAVANYRAEKAAVRAAKVHAAVNRGGRGRGVATGKAGYGSDWGTSGHSPGGAGAAAGGGKKQGGDRGTGGLGGGGGGGGGAGSANMHANIFTQQHGGLPPLGENEPLPPPTQVMHHVAGGGGRRGSRRPPPHQDQQEAQEEHAQGGGQAQDQHHPPQDLSGGDGISLSALATMRQDEAVWTGTLHRRRRLREGEPYGQTAEVSGAAAAKDASVNDPYWTLARESAGPDTFPWRRALPVSEQVARLVKDPARGSSFLGDPDFPFEGTLGVGNPGMDDTGRKSTRLRQGVLPDYPYNAPGGRVVVAPGAVLPAGMKIRHPALLNAGSFQAAIKDFLWVWDSCRDPVKRSALGMTVEVLWLKYTKFRSWAKSIYRKNKRRTDFMREHPIRFTVHCPDGRVVQVRMSRLSTGLQVRQHLQEKLKKRVRKATHGGPVGGYSNGLKRPQFVKARHVELLFDGVPLDDRVSLKDAGVGPRSTLVLTKVPAQMMQGDDGLPVY